MSKLILIVALFAAAALASSEIQDNQWWYQFFLKDEQTSNPTSGWATPVFFGSHINPNDGPSVITPSWKTGTCAASSQTTYTNYVCGDKQNNLEANMGENTCYVWVYNELGCSGEPAYAWGFVKDKIYAISSAAQTYAATADTSVTVSKNFYFDSDMTSARGYSFTSSASSNMQLQVQQADSMVAVELCDATTHCADASRPTMPVGCTDTYFMPGFPFMSHDRSVISTNQFNSMLVICNEDVGCPRSCYGKTCGSYDDCGEPCIGTCDDGYYCKHTSNKYSCEKSQYGKLTFESFVDFDSSLITMFAYSGSLPTTYKRTPPTFYTTPTITHLENAFKGDIYWASDKKVPADSIVFQEITFFTQDIHQIKIKYDINIDAVNSFLGATYSTDQFASYLSTNCFLSTNKAYQKLLGGPFTSAFNLDYYKLASTTAGTNVSQTTTVDSEWVKSVEIKDSWVAHTPEPQQDSAATLVAWMALAVPLVALLL